MRFLEAQAILARHGGGEPLPLLLAMSGSPGALPLFLRALAAQRRRAARVRTLPFATLRQHLLAVPPDEPELLLLLPWDLAPACDWRAGAPRPRELEPAALLDEARALAACLAGRTAHLFYLPAALPPLLTARGADQGLALALATIAHDADATLLPAAAFALGGYLSSGTPFASACLGDLAAALLGPLLGPGGGYKVLVTDLDNVMWRGVVGEDGLDGIHYRNEGLGFRHFVYQTLLARLQCRGVLLAAVSRNDDDLARAPFAGGRMLLGEQDFIAILASYQPKSAQIAALAAQLGLGRDAFVFVDDNPVELAEVAEQLPEVRCLRFPGQDDELPQFLATLAQCFARAAVTAEDRGRTELYRRRLAGLAPQAAAGSDLTAFLRGLEMTLEIRDGSVGDRQRAVQLIAKTNQFNLNGVRRDDAEVAALLERGGRLWVASLADRHGSHGEILACLIDHHGVVRSLVMSCRVLQRRVEYAFLAWLAQGPHCPVALAYVATARNEPMAQFLRDPAFTHDGDIVYFDAERFVARHGGAVGVFEVVAAGS